MDGARGTSASRRPGSAPTRPRWSRTDAPTGGCRGPRRTRRAERIASRGPGRAAGPQRGPAAAAEVLGEPVRRLEHRHALCSLGDRQRAGNDPPGGSRPRAGASLASCAVTVRRRDQRLAHLEAHGAAEAAAGEGKIRHDGSLARRLAGAGPRTGSSPPVADRSHLSREFVPRRATPGRSRHSEGQSHLDCC